MTNEDAELEALYEALRVELEPKLSDFDGDAAYFWDLGLPDEAISGALFAAIAENVTVPSPLYEKARALKVRDDATMDHIRDGLTRLADTHAA